MSRESGRQERLEAAVDFVRSIPQPFRATLTGPSAVKKFFQRQSDAISFAENFHGELLVFAFESSTLGNEGQRQFLASSAEGFFYEYEQLQDKFRHYYEVIIEGSPCKLYCDLEFSPSENAGLDGEALTCRFIKLLRECFALFFDKQLVTDVIVLDASSTQKFSKHVIFPDAIFANNHAMGVFLRCVYRLLHQRAFPEVMQQSCSACSAAAKKLQEEINPQPENPADFFVLVESAEQEEKPRTFFLDLAVYSRNRNFRILFSSKLSSARPLLPDPKWPLSDGLRSAELFFRSLVTFVPRTAEVLLPPWCCSCSGGLRTSLQPAASPRQEPAASFDLSGNSASIFPEIDAFLVQEVLKGVGKIRRWSYLPKRELLTYDLIGHRFCHRVGRPHRSNNVIYIVDLRRKVFYQRCQDPDCRAANFKSEEWNLPESVLPWHGILEEDNMDADEQLLVNSLEETEFELEAAKLVAELE